MKYLDEFEKDILKSVESCERESKNNKDKYKRYSPII